jgi:hypothetical protein
MTLGISLKERVGCAKAQETKRRKKIAIRCTETPPKTERQGFDRAKGLFKLKRCKLCSIP